MTERLGKQVISQSVDGTADPEAPGSTSLPNREPVLPTPHTMGRKLPKTIDQLHRKPPKCVYFG